MKVLISKKADKQLSKLNPFLRDKVLKVLKKFENGERVDIKKMKGSEREHRIRIGSYRILLDREEFGFSVTEIGKRENIYFFEF